MVRQPLASRMTDVRMSSVSHSSGNPPILSSPANDSARAAEETYAPGVAAGLIVIVERLSFVGHCALETQIPAEWLAIEIRLRSLNDGDFRIGEKSNCPDEYARPGGEVGVQLQDEGGSCMTQSVVLIACLLPMVSARVM